MTNPHNAPGRLIRPGTPRICSLSEDETPLLCAADSDGGERRYCLN